jgi:putative membrane protein
MDVMGGGMMWFGLLMMLFGLLVFAGIILLAVWAIARFAGGERQRSSTTSGWSEDPLTILQRRYARGEITRDEYERVRADLKGSGTSP